MNELINNLGINLIFISLTCYPKITLSCYIEYHVGGFPNRLTNVSLIQSLLHFTCFRHQIQGCYLGGSTFPSPSKVWLILEHNYLGMSMTWYTFRDSQIILCLNLTKGSNWQITQIRESDVSRLDLAYSTSIPSLEQKHSSCWKIFKSRYNDIALISVYLTDTFCSFTRNAIFKSFFLLSLYRSSDLIYKLARCQLEENLPGPFSCSKYFQTYLTNYRLWTSLFQIATWESMRMCGVNELIYVCNLLWKYGKLKLWYKCANIIMALSKLTL